MAQGLHTTHTTPTPHPCTCICACARVCVSVCACARDAKSMLLLRAAAPARSMSAPYACVGCRSMSAPFHTYAQHPARCRAANIPRICACCPTSHPRRPHTLGLRGFLLVPALIAYVTRLDVRHRQQHTAIHPSAHVQGTRCNFFPLSAVLC